MSLPTEPTSTPSSLPQYFDDSPLLNLLGLDIDSMTPDELHDHIARLRELQQTTQMRRAVERSPRKTKTSKPKLDAKYADLLDDDEEEDGTSYDDLLKDEEDDN